MSKVFDTVDHSILLKNLEMNVVNTKNLSGLASHFNSRKQYMKINEYADTVTKDIKSVAPQGSIIGSLLFLLHINDPLNSSNVFVPIVFADNIIYFLSTVT